jgi:uncharacterized CHY-type Zn-finger protein
MEKKEKKKYICEVCGKEITLEQYLSVDIMSLAKCDKCKTKK